MGEISKATAMRAVSPAQSTAISFVDDHGDAITITSDDVRMHICPQANAKEVAYFMELCRAQRLNPFLNEAYLVKFQGKPAQIMVSHKALVKRAEQHPEYDGMEHGVVVMRDGQVHQEQRGAYYPEAGEVLLGGWAKVYRKDRRMPIYAERSFKSMNKGQANWKSMPDVMIDKCAQAAALREAFPDELRAMYVREEMGSVPAQEVQAEVSTPPESQTHITVPEAPQEDIVWLRNATKQLVEMGYDRDEVKAYLWKTYRTVGINAARTWVESQIDSQPEFETEGEPVDVDTQAEEIEPNSAPTDAEVYVSEGDEPDFEN
jgi:phage recombination protein Bet